LGENWSPSIAIVGSGPSGCYSAQFLRKKYPEASIKIYDRLPVPYGLVRFGVAPDHVGTRAVTQQFDRLFQRDGVKFLGSTEVGKDISLEQLRAENDIVILANGLSSDRKLDIAGQELRGVHGSGRLTRLINGHPDESHGDLTLGERIVIVGQGNVAIDLIRLTLTHPEQLEAYGVSSEVAKLISSGQLISIDIVGRSGIESAKFDVAMIKELAKVEDVRFTSDQRDLSPEFEESEALRRLEAVNSLIQGSPKVALRTVNFRFGWVPQSITGIDSVNGISFQHKDTGEKLSLPADAVLTAIGFAEAESAAIKLGAHIDSSSDLERGYLADGLYCVGWMRRGPKGTIPANRSDAKMVTDAIIEDFEKLNEIKDQ
jgi:ferredoxin/flavodoxin---NADP+ reductase